MNDTNSTDKVLSDYIDSRTQHLDSYPDVVRKAVDTIVGQGVSPRLKLGVALSELITLVSHLRKPIVLFDGTLVPVNAISVILSPSGSSKDKSMNTVRKALLGSYTKLEALRKQYAVDKARELANLNGDNPENYERYYEKPIPLQSGLGTPEGITNHLAGLSAKPLGAGSFSCSELAAEMQTNGSFTEIVKILSVGYDLGDVPVKVIKSSENQTSGVTGMPINGLLFGSFDTILYQQDVKNKFKLLFNTQLARRSLFVFTPEVPYRVPVTSIDELYTIRNREREQVLHAQRTLAELTDSLVDNTTQEPMALDQAAEKLFDVYQEFNSVRSDRGSNRYPISKLSRKHKQWLAMKVAAAYSILAGENTVTEECYAYAINTVELLSGDLKEFELELAKDQHENLVGYCKLIAEDGVSIVSMHELRKLGYINGTGGSKSKVDEIAALANSYDKDGSYAVLNGGIEYSELIKSKSVGVSHIVFGDDKKDKEFKSYAQDKCYEGYEFEEDMQFADLEELLGMNAAFSPFLFKDGKRSKDNVEGGTGLLVLDIDEGNMTDEEVHLLLDSMLHYVVRSSDPDNAYKYRVILSLDIDLDVDDDLYKVFVQCAAEELGLVADSLPKSQIFFSYAGRNILSQMEGSKLGVKDLLDTANAIMRDKPKKPVRELPTASKKALLDDARETFSIGYEAERGNGSVLMYRMLKYAADLGADEEYITGLAEDINSTWIEPMDVGRLMNTLVNPIIRKM